MATATSRNGGKTTKERDVLDEVLQQPIGDTRQDLLAMRMENETIMAECRARPRDMSAIKEELADLLECFPDLAEEAIYTKPVGKDRDGREKFAEGLSIRAAEALAEAYGFNRVRCDASPCAEGAKVEATFTDFQKGRIWQDGGVVPRRFKAYGGQIKEHPEDRFWDVVVKAKASIRVREVILRSVNPALKAWFENECRKVLAKVLTDDKIAAIVNQFKGVGVTLEMLETVIGRPASMGWTNSDRQKLLGIWNAIKANEISVAEAFAVDVTPPEPPKRVKGSKLAAPPKEFAPDGSELPGELFDNQQDATEL